MAVTSKAKRRDWQLITAGSGIEHGQYLSPAEKYALEEKQRKAKFISGGFLVC